MSFRAYHLITLTSAKKNPLDISFEMARNERKKPDIPQTLVLIHLKRCVKNGDVEGIDQVLATEDDQYWIIQYHLNLE
jgi:hypothetical protein